MKISQMPQLPSATGNELIPVSVGGQNMALAASALAQVIAPMMLRFSSLQSNPSATISEGAATSPLPIVYDNGRFYAMYQHDDSITYYSLWDGSERYMRGSSVRTDCIFAADDGRLYFHNGAALIAAGFTAALANQLSLLTPIEMSEDEMEALIESGEAVEGQIYYIPEE